MPARPAPADGLRLHPGSSSALRTGSSLLLRPATASDVEAMAAIYADAVHSGTASFELQAPSAGELAQRQAAVLDKGLPWLVAERDAALLGYAYAGPFRPRPAYRFTVENSIYLAPQARGHGVGRLLLAELIARCEACGVRQMLAVIGDSGNAASIGLHHALGFTPVGTLSDVGRKFDRWLDVVLMQRTLGAGAATPPAAGS